MNKITMWSLHICSCVVLYEWDTEMKEDDRRHTIVSQCTGKDGTQFKTVHCGGSHPFAIPGEKLEQSAFYKDFLLRLSLHQEGSHGSDSTLD